MPNQEIASVAPSAPEHKVGKVKSIFGRVGLTAALLLGGGAAVIDNVVGPAEPASADTGGYPWADAEHVSIAFAGDNITWGYKNKSDCDDKSSDYDCSGSMAGRYYFRDQWGYDLRNCTSYVAWRVAKEFGVSVAGWGNAETWDNRASDAGYSVDTTPEAGDIAVWDSRHVAFVEAVNSDGSVKVSQYNAGLDGYYSTATRRADHYIDINGTGKGLTQASGQNSLNEAKPFALKRGDAMEVFYRDTSDRLESAGWTPTKSWQGPFVRSSGEVASNPVALSRGIDSMDVFYRDYAGNIRNIGWTATSGWGVSVARVTDGSVTADIAAISRGPDSMDIFYRNGVGNLVNIGWTALGGWSKPQTLVANGSVAGSPVAVARDAQNMDVFYSDRNGNLQDVGWDAKNGWKPPYTRASKVVGTPAVISRGPTKMDVYFRDTANGLDNAWWDAGSGWHLQNLEGSGVNSDPAVLARTGNDQSVFFVDNGWNLREKSWSSASGWAGSVARASNVTGSPSAMARTDGNMDVFVRGTNGQMVNAWWDWRLGWNIGTPVPSNVRQ